MAWVLTLPVSIALSASLAVLPFDLKQRSATPKAVTAFGLARDHQ
jgi:hypothetical protein